MDERLKNVNVRVDASLHDAFKVAVRARDLDMNKVVRQLLKQYCELNGIDWKQGKEITAR